jgi:hypothetical protein
VDKNYTEKFSAEIEFVESIPGVFFCFFARGFIFSRRKGIYLHFSIKAFEIVKMHFIHSYFTHENINFSIKAFENSQNTGMHGIPKTVKLHLVAVCMYVCMYACMYAGAD